MIRRVASSTVNAGHRCDALDRAARWTSSMCSSPEPVFCQWPVSRYVAVKLPLCFCRIFCHHFAPLTYFAQIHKMLHEYFAQIHKMLHVLSAKMDWWWSYCPAWAGMLLVSQLHRSGIRSVQFALRICGAVHILTTLAVTIANTKSLEDYLCDLPLELHSFRRQLDIIVCPRLGTIYWVH